MADESQADLIGRQFGPRAEAYLTSAVHAQGADLDALSSLAAQVPQARTLDLGCGGGHTSFAAARTAAEVVAYDLSSDMLEVVARTARERGLDNIVTRQGSVEQLPFADASFDCVVSRFSAHHWSGLAAALAQARRVLKPTGVFGLVDAVSPGPPLLDTWLQALELIRDPSHVRDYSVAEWTDALACAGFRLRRMEQWRLPLAYAAWVERMATPPCQCDAIRALQAAASDDVRRRFEIGEDGSFVLDCALFVAIPV